MFHWADLAFGDKRPVNELKATFIMAPRDMSVARFTQLVKQHLPQGNIIVGLANEPYVAGFEDQPQFGMLQMSTVMPVIRKIWNSGIPHKVYTLRYHQRDTVHVLGKLKFRKVVLVNGSWHYAFHTRQEYYTLVNRRVPFEMVSPFTDEAEARAYAQHLWLQIVAASGLKAIDTSQPRDERGMLAIADAAARMSYDYNFQTGVALGRHASNGYMPILYACNTVVPYQTYAMHHGASREKHFSPPHDLNHYDTVHAEVELILHAQRQGTEMQGTTVFINLLPCPPCARMLSQTDITEIVYQEDHSAGYAVRLLEAAGKTVRRLV